ncbi:MAG: hypothetical protein ACM3WS_06160 [Bacillota bacterium]
MHRENPSTLHSLPDGRQLQDVADVSYEQPAATEAEAEQAAQSMLGRHKGKLAVGAAAMLGIAIFYKWREHWLSKEEPEEYARLRRLKQAVKNEERTRRTP